MQKSDHTIIDLSDNRQGQPKSLSILSIQRVWRRLSRLQRALIAFTFIVVATITARSLFLHSNIPPRAARIHPRGRIPSIDSKTAKSGQPVHIVKSVKPVKPVIPPAASTKVDAVIEAFKHSWKAYKLYAWGKDEVHPLTHSSSTWMGAALTMVDALDTMWMMGFRREFAEARDYLATNLDFNLNRDHVNVFETTIRVLGGLLSAYYLTNDRMFLKKAIDLGNRLSPAFETPSSIPMSDINLASRTAQAPAWGQDSTTAEVATLSLEFLTLAKASGQPKFKTLIDRLSQRLHQATKKDGLVPIFINFDTGVFRSEATITLGGRGDSYYEYLLKQWILTNKTVNYLRDDYLKAVEGMKKHLFRRSHPSKLLFVGELIGGRSFTSKMDHLVCFLPGTLAYGVMHGMPKHHLEYAKELMETCYQMYRQTPTGLSPEIVVFNMESVISQDFSVKPLDKHNLQRPETVESLFYLYRITKDEKYRRWGWEIFQAFEKYTKLTVAGYVSIGDVTRPENVRYRTKCESFWFAETLKYFFLLFSNSSALDLQKFVINTEAHPLPIG